MKFRHGSLFSGIGGFDLAAEWMGWENVFHCEWNEFGRRILKYYWPNAISYGDITKTDFTIHRGTIDILTGGFPCQPYSQAGKRLGKDDDRHLWPEMLRAIREISPTYIVGENVYGLVNWNGGMVFNEVQTDLENEGYEILPVILPACAVNAPHRRERIWFVAYSNKSTKGPSRTSSRAFGERSGNNDEPKEWGKQTEQHFGHGNVYGINFDTGLQRQEERQKQTMGVDELCQEWNVTDTNSFNWRCKSQKRMRETGAWREFDRESEGFTNDATHAGCSFGENGLHGEEQGGETTKFGDSYTKFGAWTKFPITEPTICRRNDGFSSELDGITFYQWRNETIKAYGNAIVPQIALQIFNAINLHAVSYCWR
jgi:DNA (cytosine-5)-methyltransferase 1